MISLTYHILPHPQPPPPPSSSSSSSYFLLSSTFLYCPLPPKKLRPPTPPHQLPEFIPNSSVQSLAPFTNFPNFPPLNHNIFYQNILYLSLPPTSPPRGSMVIGCEFFHTLKKITKAKFEGDSILIGE